MSKLLITEAISTGKRGRFIYSMMFTCSCGFRSKWAEPVVIKKQDIDAYKTNALKIANLIHQCKHV